jgi:hypothetical protein
MESFRAPTRKVEESMVTVSNRDACWVMEPREIADLTEIFDEACHRTMTARDSEAGQMIAKRLLAAVHYGIKDRDWLPQRRPLSTSARSLRGSGALKIPAQGTYVRRTSSDLMTRRHHTVTDRFYLASKMNEEAIHASWTGTDARRDPQ